MRKLPGIVLGLIAFQSYAQVDTTFLYNNNKPYGSLDIRIARSATSFYYLEENRTFSFRENASGAKTNTYLDMTSWDSSPYTEGHLREQNGTSSDFVMNYRLLFPQGYDASYEPGYPLIIIFHGLGERANCWDQVCYHADHSYSPVQNSPPAPTDGDHRLLNNDHPLSNSGYVHLLARNAAESKFPDDETLEPRAFPGFVLVPQNLNGWDINSTQDAIRLLRLVGRKYNVDEDRIYIHGLSNGGLGVYEALKRAPWMFAAALTMSAISDANINTQQMAGDISHIPLWVFQGAQDVKPYPQRTENYIKQFRDAGVSVRYTKYWNLGHGTWSTAYNEPDFFTWILARNRADIHAFGGVPMICGDGGLRLEMPEGYFAYQWRVNGQTIPDADGSFYVATRPGIYTGRFSRHPDPAEQEWNQWSNPLEVKAGEPLAQAEVQQIGTVLLRDLNNFPNARLRSAGQFDHYYWYKNGALIDFPGDMDDTLRNATITPTMGKGVYTLATANRGNCLSPQSAAKYIFFNNQAPVNIAAPADLKGDITGPEVKLTWRDASSGENGFEIWRRRKLGTTNFGPWEMAALTAPNAKDFKDAQLYPSSVYEYKIRAVSTSGRSEYHPSGKGVEVTTGEDTEPPSAPSGLVATATGVQKTRLVWRKSTDNTVLRDYIVHYASQSVSTGSRDTIFTINDLPLNAIVDVYVEARDVAGNVSEPSDPKQLGTFISGLFYEHNTGFVTDLDSIDWTTPEFTGMVHTFSLAPKTQDDYFNFRFDGYVYITKKGGYQFRTGSNDGSRLRLNNRLIVENDGIHDLATRTSGYQTLQTGPHRITVDFFDYIDRDTLAVQYKGPDTGNEWRFFTIDVLKSDPDIVTATADNELPADSFSLSVYPNPTFQSNIKVHLRSTQRSPVHVRLLDPVGRQLFEEVFDFQLISEGVQLSPAGTLSPGIYFIIATQENATARQRLLIGKQ